MLLLKCSKRRSAMVLMAMMRTVTSGVWVLSWWVNPGQLREKSFKEIKNLLQYLFRKRYFIGYQGSIDSALSKIYSLLCTSKVKDTLSF